MDFQFSEEQRLLRDSVRKMMDKLATPEYIRRLDKEQAYPYELYDTWTEMGLMRMPFPVEYGGLGGNALDMVIIAEELSNKSFDFFTAYGASTFCGLNVARKGTEAQKSRWIPRLLAGDIKMSIAMSEPDAGSDVGAMRTTATRAGDGWEINGQKLWATAAGAKRNVINVYVKTNTKVHHKQGISLFLVENDRPGVTLRKLEMLGRRCVGTYEIFFDKVQVPMENLVGGENKGWDCVLSGLQLERITTRDSRINSATKSKRPAGGRNPVLEPGRKFRTWVVMLSLRRYAPPVWAAGARLVVNKASPHPCALTVSAPQCA